MSVGWILYLCGTLIFLKPLVLPDTRPVTPQACTSKPGRLSVYKVLETWLAFPA